MNPVPCAQQQSATRPWQRNLASATPVEDASHARKRNIFFPQAKEFVPKSLRGKSSPKDDAETSQQVDGIQLDKKTFPWRMKQQSKTADVEDEDDDDSTTLETALSTPTCCGSSVAPSFSATASNDHSSTPSENDDQEEDISDTHAEAEWEVGPQDEKPAKEHEHECGKDETSGLKVSANSWAAKRWADRNSRNAEELSDEEILRKMTSILNKLTMEKFPALSKQLASCGIKTSVHLELLIQEIFEKAVTQHNFINMYADLCVVLQNHFAEHPISNDPSTNLKKILSNACQSSFVKHLIPPENLSTLEGDDLEVAEQMYKMQMIGNIKLVGALIVRKILASKVLFAIVEALLNAGMPEALETLAALLTVVGPSFDRPDCQHRALFVGIFDQVEAIAKDKNVKLRIRCLLRDLLELRAADWQDSKPKKLEGPSTLEDVAQKFYGEGHQDWDKHHCRAEYGHAYKHKRSDWGQGSPPATRTKLRSVVHRAQEFRPQVQAFPSVLSCDNHVDEPPAECKEECMGQPEKCNEEVQRNESQEDAFDKTACNKKIAQAFIALMSTQDIHQAVASIAALKVPDSLQSKQLCDLLRFIVEAGVEKVRSVGYQLIVAIYSEGCWSHASLVKGFQNFERLCAAKEVHAPGLAKILCAEMVPTFAPLVQGGLLPIDPSWQRDCQLVENSGAHADDGSCKGDRQNKNRRKKESLIDKAAAAQRQQEEKTTQAIWALQEERSMQANERRYCFGSPGGELGHMVAPSVYNCAPTMLTQYIIQ